MKAYASGWPRSSTCGEVVRADHPDPSAFVHGVVGEGEALFAYVQLTTSALELPGRALGAAGLQLPRLAPEQALLLHLT